MIYINKEITDYIITNYGIDAVEQVINGSLLLNDHKLNSMLSHIVGYTGERRTFKISLGNLSNETINEFIAKFRTEIR